MTAPRIAIQVAGGAALPLLLFASTDAPPAAAAADLYGAIVFSRTTGAIGWSNDFRSREGALNKALSECRRRGGGCRVATWFKNACGALAVGDDNFYGGAWGASRFEAESEALTHCRKEARDCNIRRWVCTGH